MRLGDLDALYDEVSNHVTSVSVCATAQQAIGQTDFKWRCLEDIDATPTIDAIPVEWLKEFDLYYAGISGGTKYMNELVEAWQREQEAQG